MSLSVKSSIGSQSLALAVTQTMKIHIHVPWHESDQSAPGSCDGPEELVMIVSHGSRREGEAASQDPSLSCSGIIANEKLVFRLVLGAAPVPESVKHTHRHTHTHWGGNRQRCSFSQLPLVLLGHSRM